MWGRKLFTLTAFSHIQNILQHVVKHCIHVDRNKCLVQIFSLILLSFSSNDVIVYSLIHAFINSSVYQAFLFIYLDLSSCFESWREIELMSNDFQEVSDFNWLWFIGCCSIYCSMIYFHYGYIFITEISYLNTSVVSRQV